MLDFENSNSKPDPKSDFDIHPKENNNNDNLDDQSIKIMIKSVRDYNNNPRMSCDDVVNFLKDYDQSKKLFNDISITELDHIILATEHVCDSTP